MENKPETLLNPFIIHIIIYSSKSPFISFVLKSTSINKNIFNIYSFFFYVFNKTPTIIFYQKSKQSPLYITYKILYPAQFKITSNHAIFKSMYFRFTKSDGMLKAYSTFGNFTATHDSKPSRLNIWNSTDFCRDVYKWKCYYGCFVLFHLLNFDFSVSHMRTTILRYGIYIFSALCFCRLIRNKWSGL